MCEWLVPTGREEVSQFTAAGQPGLLESPGAEARAVAYSAGLPLSGHDLVAA